MVKDGVGVAAKSWLNGAPVERLEYDFCAGEIWFRTACGIVARTTAKFVEAVAAGWRGHHSNPGHGQQCSKRDGQQTWSGHSASHPLSGTVAPACSGAAAHEVAEA